jgi:hypothetical protein
MPLWITEILTGIARDLKRHWGGSGSCRACRQGWQWKGGLRRLWRKHRQIEIGANTPR